ncbi:hypothetical protein VULLAG_LOCUS13126 [Vulpes lagopus]
MFRGEEKGEAQAARGSKVDAGTAAAPPAGTYRPRRAPAEETAARVAGAAGPARCALREIPIWIPKTGSPSAVLDSVLISDLLWGIAF